MNSHDCIFCKIVGGKQEADRVFENENVLAFLDIGPVNPGHTLVVPKVHYENIYTLPDGELAALLVAARRVAIAVKRATGADGTNIHMNNDPAAGQAVPHAHVHVIPRFAGDGLTHWPHRDVPEDVMRETGGRIKEELASLSA